MKKKITMMLATAMVVGSIPSVSFAATDNHVTKVVDVKNDSELKKNGAPSLVIEASGDHNEKFAFELQLSNAEWSDDVDDWNDFVPDGITLNRITSTEMMVTVDTDDFNAAKKDIEIPLITKITGSEGQAKVKVDGTNSTVSSGEYVFASIVNTDATFEVAKKKEFGRTGELAPIKINDYSVSQMTKDDRIKFQLSNSFIFTEEGTVTGTGKYDGNVEVEIDKDNPSIAYLTVKKSVSGKTGTILWSDIKVKAGEDAEFGDITLSINKSGKNTKITVGEYINEYEEIEIDTIEKDESRPTITGTSDPKATIKIFVDGKENGMTTADKKGNWKYKVSDDLDSGMHTIKAQYYDEDTKELYDFAEETYTTEFKDTEIEIAIGKSYFEINGRKHDLDAAAYIDENDRTMLPLRAIANALGIDNSDIVWDPKKEEVTITRADKVEIRIMVGEAAIYIDDAKTTIDTKAVIVKDRVFLPLRAIANALGVDDDDIDWDQKSKTVIINK